MLASQNDTITQVSRAIPISKSAIVPNRKSYPMQYRLPNLVPSISHFNLPFPGSHVGGISCKYSWSSFKFP